MLRSLLLAGAVLSVSLPAGGSLAHLFGAAECPEGTRRHTERVIEGSMTVCKRPDGTSHGPALNLYDDGARRFEGQWHEGKSTGRWRHWKPSGLLWAEGAWHDGERVGRWRYWNSEGVLEREVEYVDGAEHGFETRYHRNGQPAERGRNERGAKAGVWQSWDAQGRLRSEREHNGNRPGIWRAFDDNGALKWAGLYLHGMPHGDWDAHHEDGSSERGRYEGGQRVGEWTFTQPGGRTTSGRFAEGRRVGVWRTFDANGELVEETPWIRGLEGPIQDCPGGSAEEWASGGCDGITVRVCRDPKGNALETTQWSYGGAKRGFE